MRSTERLIVLGFNGTGKTTFVKKLVAAYLKKDDRKALIITPDDREWNDLETVELNKKTDFYYTGAKRTIFLKDYTMHRVTEYFHDAMIVFDDCRGYLPPALDMDIHNLMIRSRQKMLDIVAVGHGFTEVPPKFFTFCTKIILFQTKDKIEKRRDCIIEFDKVKEAQERINQKAIDFPHYFEVIKF